VGFFSRLLVPRSVRRAVHPGRAVKRAVTPKPIKKVSRALHPVDNAVYSLQRSAATSIRSGRKRKARVFRHGRCPIEVVVLTLGPLASPAHAELGSTVSLAEDVRCLRFAARRLTVQSGADRGMMVL
jgi:hypothetical protein